MQRDSFIFYRSFYEAINDLPEKNQLQIYKAICELSLNFEEIDLKGISATIFRLIKPQLEANNKRFINGQKGGQYGNLGGRPRKPQTKPQENPKETPNNNDNVNDNVNDNDNATDNDNIYDYIQENFGRLLAPADYEKISEWEDNDLTRYAIKKAVINNKCSVGYIDGILRGYRRNKIVTVQQAQDEEEQFIKQKEQNNKYKGLSYKEQQYLREQEMMDKFVRGEI